VATAENEILLKFRPSRAALKNGERRTTLVTATSLRPLRPERVGLVGRPLNLLDLSALLLSLLFTFNLGLGL
jgi:hypothetical protein